MKSCIRLAGLLSEALALVDLLVLVRASRFTGFGSSTMSWVVQEYRCWSGLGLRLGAGSGLGLGLGFGLR